MPKGMPDWQRELADHWKTPVVVMGVGRRGHGDDAVGPLLIDRLPEASGLVGIDCGTAPENFVGVARRYRPGLVLLVDAVDTGAPPGTVQLFAPDQLAHTGLGTHGVSLALFLKLLADQTQAPCFLLGIEAERAGPARPPSPVVRCAAEMVAESLANLLAKEQRARRS